MSLQADWSSKDLCKVRMEMDIWKIIRPSRQKQFPYPWSDGKLACGCILISKLVIKKINLTGP